MEIVLPRLAKVMTVWEFVLMKVMNIYTLHLDLLKGYGHSNLMLEVRKCVRALYMFPALSKYSIQVIVVVNLVIIA